MRRHPALAVTLLLAASLTDGLLAPAALAADPEPQLTATLDGKPIPVEEVGRHFCDDFAYPEIRCWSSRVIPDARATLVGILAAVDYVTIYDGATFGGVYMNVSQDYSALAFIGWNDRISSFRGRNSETGAFYVDWFYGGSSWAFCCNQQYSNLGTYNNTFSSILRT